MLRPLTISLSLCVVVALAGGCRNYSELEGRSYYERPTPGWYGSDYPIENRGRGLEDWAFKESRIPTYCPVYCTEVCIACDKYYRDSSRESQTANSIAQRLNQPVVRAFGGCPPAR